MPITSAATPTQLPSLSELGAMQKDAIKSGNHARAQAAGHAAAAVAKANAAVTEALDLVQFARES